MRRVLAGECLRLSLLSPEGSRAARLWMAAALLLITALLCLASPATAQVSDAVMLARTCVSERGWRTETDDCAAIGGVVRWRMGRRDVSFRSALTALAPRLHHPECRVSRRWLCELDEGGARPRHLGPARWDGTRRTAWLATLDEARSILAGSVPSPCSSGLHAWGSTADLERRRLAGYRWVPAVCPGAVFANHFGRLFREAP